MPYVRTVRTASGATAVQIVYSSGRGSRDIHHIGSAHDDVELELLKAVARQRLAAGQGVLDLGLEATEPAREGAGGGRLPITASRMGFLLDAREYARRMLGLGGAAGWDEVFADLVLARIIEPVSKLDSLRVLEEGGAGRPGHHRARRPRRRRAVHGVRAGTAARRRAGRDHRQHARPGGLRDDPGEVIAAARAAGLVYAQHIVALHAAITGGQLTPGPPGAARPDEAAGPRPSTPASTATCSCSPR